MGDPFLHVWLTAQELLRAADTLQKCFPDKDFRAAVLADSIEDRSLSDSYPVPYDFEYSLYTFASKIIVGTTW